MRTEKVWSDLVVTAKNVHRRAWASFSIPATALLWAKLWEMGTEC